MSNYHHSGPAFPVHETPDSTDSPGMTLRDYFAAKAMQGDWAYGNAAEEGNTFEDDAARYYAMADAMLNERAK